MLAGKRSPRSDVALARDPQLVLMEMADGVLVEVESFVNCRYGYDVRCEVVGSEGTLTLENPLLSQVTRSGTRAQEVPTDWRVRFNAAYHEELQEWVNGLADGIVAGPSAWDGYAATVVGTAAVRSVEGAGRVEVPLVEKPGLYA